MSSGTYTNERNNQCPVHVWPKSLLTADLIANLLSRLRIHQILNKNLLFNFMYNESDHITT